MTGDAAELAYAGIARQAERVAAGEVSARELAEASLERIARLDPELNAFRVVLAERAVAEADQADARRAAGDRRPLLGVPIAVKDVSDVAGEVTTHGTSAHGPPARRDSELVRRLRAAGAVVIGKTHTPELAQWGFTESATFGVTRNPWRLDRTPGGSSGGSAAAVAAGLVGAATASDGLGSIRIPAASCGLFGLKVQRGRVPLAPDEDHWHGLSVAGALTRSVLDTALFLDAVADAPAGGSVASDAGGAFAAAARRQPDRLRIVVAVNPPPPLRRAGDAVLGAIDDTAELLRGLGHEVVEGRIDYGAAVTRALVRALRGVHDDAARMPAPRRLERRTRTAARLGSLVPVAAIARERAREPGAARRLGSILAGRDVLLTPTTAAPATETGALEGLGPMATRLGEGMRWPGGFTPAWNLTGQPAAAVPAGFDERGLALSVQLVGHPSDEATLLSLAAELEAARPWAERRPPLA
jgi:amidase